MLTATATGRCGNSGGGDIINCYDTASSAPEPNEEAFKFSQFLAAQVEDPNSPLAQLAQDWATDARG